MQIFVLDSIPHTCAKYHSDIHVNSQIKEAAQMLSTAVRVTEGILNEMEFEGLNKSFIPNHPCNIWVRESLNNADWLFKLACHLNEERKYRFNRNDHKSIFVCCRAIKILQHLPMKGLTPFAQSMPDEYKHSNAVTAYRQYYIHEKSHLAKWTRRPVPYWWKGT